VRSWLVDLESCETLHLKMLKSVSDGQRAVASPSVPLDRNIPHEFYTGIGIPSFCYSRALPPNSYVTINT